VIPLLLDEHPLPPTRPCAFQGCDRAAEVYPVVQLPPPALARNGQPMRYVFRRSAACDAHRRQIVAQLAAHLREALTAYFVLRALPPADWDQASWEYQPVEVS
jgi:hypothetical protein